MLKRTLTKRAAVLGVLATAATAAAAPAPAEASSSCSETEFCLYIGSYQDGGVYHYSGSDGNLHNDLFHWLHSPPGQVVANESQSFWNRGTDSGPPHVRVYTGVNGTGSHTCAPQGSSGPLRGTFRRNIESFYWRSSC